MGALLIKEREGLTDRGTVAAIQEDPFFIGLEEFTDERAFDATLMVDFRKRFGEAGLSRISEAVALAQTEAKPKEQENGSSDEDASDNDSSTDNSSTRDSDVAAAEEKTACTDSNNTNSNNTDTNQDLFAPINGQLLFCSDLHIYLHFDCDRAFGIRQVCS